jgi:hypothetical protein
MQPSDITWNDEARAKILEDSDRVLRNAVLELAKSSEGRSSDEVYADLFSALKDKFIDFEPGPDIRTYADAIVAGDFAE